MCRFYFAGRNLPHFFFFKVVRLEVMKPTDPGKCAQPVLLCGEGKFAGKCLAVRLFFYCIYRNFVLDMSRPQYSLLISRQLNNYA